MSGRWLSYATLVLAGTLGAGACSDGHEAESHVVCPPEARTVLVAEKLTRSVSSTPFDVAAGQEAWVSVVGDADYNPSALFPTVATLYLIDAGSEPQVREDANGLPIIDDPAISFEAEGEWWPATAVSGRYQLWSRRGPIIEVAACPASRHRD